MVVGLVLAAAVSAPPVFADPGLAVALGRIDAKPGAWAEYLVRRGSGGDARLRVTALTGPAEGSHWLEVAGAAGSGIALAVRLLVRNGGSSGLEVERMSLVLAGQQPLEIPLDRVKPRSRPPVPLPRRVGDATVRVRGGVFTAELLRGAGMWIWRSAEVPLWGLVRARSRTMSVELIAWGWSGGHSVFPAGGDQGKGSERAK